MVSQIEYISNLKYAKDLIQRQLDQNQRRLGDYLTGPRGISGIGDFGFYLVVNDAELVSQLEAHMGQELMYARMMQRIKAQFLPEAIPILGDIFIDAAEMQHPGAFPPEYLKGILYAIYKIPPPTVVGAAPQNALVHIPYLPEHLGGPDEFEAAFHHGAIKEKREQLRNKKGKFVSFKVGYQLSRVNVRRETVFEENLKEQNAHRRYKYWKLVYEGKKSFDVYNRDLGVTQEYPVYGSWEDTIDARLEAWKRVKAGGAPQWLLLEYGQPRFAPKIIVKESFGATGPTRIESPLFGGKSGFVASDKITIPGNISGKWVRKLSEKWTEVVISVWSEQVIALNRAITPSPKAPSTPPTAIGSYKSPRLGQAYRVSSSQYGVFWYSYRDYLARQMGSFFDLNGRIVRTSELNIFGPRGGQIR